MAKLTPTEEALRIRASQALDELRRKWRALGVPPDGAAGLLLAEFLNVCINDRGMTTAEAIADIIDCFESPIFTAPRGQA